MRYNEPLRPGNGPAQDVPARAYPEESAPPRSLNVSRRLREGGSWRREITDSFRAITGRRRAPSGAVSREQRRSVDREWREAERAQEHNARAGDDDGRFARDGMARSSRHRPDYAGYRPPRSRLAEGWREFTESVRALSTQLPGFSRRGDAWGESGAWRDDGARMGWDESQASAEYYTGGLGAAGSSSFALPAFARSRRFEFLSWNISYAVAAVLAIVSLIVGFLGSAGIVRVADLGLAALDAKSQISFIQTVAKNGEILQTERLVEVKSRLGSLSKDLQRIEADLPSAVSGSSNAQGVMHLLRMGQYFTQAGLVGIDVPIALLPALKGMMSGLGGTTTSNSTATAPSLTAQQISQLADKVDTAGALVQQGLRERSLVRDSDLQSLGFGSLIPTLHKLDDEAPKLDKYLGYAHIAMGALPGLLGLTGQESHFLLFSMDSDELRPTGGFLGNYAVVTLANAKLKDPVHLRDIYSLDCPNGDNSCPDIGVPEKFGWFGFDWVGLTHEFNLRDSNLDPDVPSSAILAETLGKVESLPDMNGVVWFTPGLIKRVLQVTGPIKVDTFGRTITPDNLQDTIHYFHILSAFCGNLNHKQDPRYADLYAKDCPDLLGAANSANALQTSDRKAFDAVLGSSLLHTFGTLPPDKQGKLFKAILDAMQAKDLVLYFNDPGLEGLLSSFKLDNAVQKPQGDSLYVVDSNVGATYVNGDVNEKISDTITINADGSASHDLSITYDYPVVPHLWSDIYEPAQGVWAYHDFVRVITPEHMRIDDFESCKSYPGLQQDGRDAFGCYFSLARADKPRDCRITPCYKTTNTVHIQWTVPNVVTKANGVSQYALYVQKQPGTHSTVAVKIILPDGMKLKQPLADPLKAGPNGSILLSGPLDKDQSFTLSFG